MVKMKLFAQRILSVVSAMAGRVIKVSRAQDQYGEEQKRAVEQTPAPPVQQIAFPPLPGLAA